jgi:HPt (histidine-containing phosphotransfer) domain-containing protein
MASKFTYADLEYLESMSVGNDMIADMIDLFVQQISEFSEGLTTHLTSGDLTALGALAHKAKSSVAVMGMNSLANDLKILESTTKAGEEKENYPVLVNRCIDQVSVTAEELTAYVKSLR